MRASASPRRASKSAHPGATKPAPFGPSPPAGGAYQGNPYVNVLGDRGSPAPGQSVTIALEFLVSGRHRKDGDDFSYGLDALLGI